MPQPHLDRLASLLASSFEAPIALLSLVEDGRQRIVACAGLEPREGERAASLCADADRWSQGPLVVANLLEDPRFARDPLVAGPPGIRFLAGAPLTSSDGLGLGMLCVADTAPRAHPSPRQLRTLEDLAAMAGHHVELHRQLTEKVQSDEARFRLAAIVDSSDDAILAKSLEGTITSWNGGAEKLYGYRAEEVVGEHISILVPPDRRAEVDDILAHIRRGEPVNHLDTVRLRKDGTPVEVSVTISPVRNAEGMIVGASTIARDIGERKRMEASLSAARDAQIEANRTKSEFLATMSHEIRTPMNGVIGMAGLLLDTELDREQREFAEAVRSSGEALLSIVNEILDFSKIEAGRMELELTEFDPRNIVEEVADLLAERAHAKGLEMAALVEPDVPGRVRGDPGRLRQILTNLLGNAVKFTEQGEVVMGVTVAGQADGDALLRFEVTDTGKGVAPGAEARLFEPFAQADASTTRTHGGTGLGLAISKRLVELMGGEIGVESMPAGGSRFWFTAGLAPVPEGASRRIPRNDLRGLRVLVVDDNRTNRRILERQVASWGMHAGMAEGAGRALELLRAGVAAGEPYHVALLDMEMPEVNGLELAAAIHADQTLPAIPLLLLTSSVRGSAQARDAGISAFLTKPVRQSRLYDTLAMVMGAETATSEMVTRHTISEARAARPRLLLAEDNAVNQRVAVAMLQKIGYPTDVVANGAEAVEAVSRIPYRAVLMDCQMPEMDGYQAAREIRSREGGDRHIPIIAMTAGAMPGDRERCLAAGMDDYLSKPVEVDTLEAALRRWVEGEDDSTEAPTEDRGPPAAALDPDRLSELRSLQQEGRSDIVAELIGLFVDGAPARLGALEAALAAHDAEALREAAHVLKGSSANLGATRLAALCAELEGLGQSGQLTPAAETLGHLETELRRVLTAFRAELHKTAAH